MLDYKLINKKEDIATKLRRLHREIKLAICIVDHNNDENTNALVKYFSEFSEARLYISISDDKLRVKKMAQELPDVNFLVFEDGYKYCDIYNAISKECFSTYFLITDSTVLIDYLDIDKLIYQLDNDSNILAITPRLYNKLNELIPSIAVPAILKKQLEIVNFIPSGEDNIKTLFPFGGIALYNRALFQRLRELDSNIESKFWQLVDMGLTCYLFGYKIVSSPHFKAHYICGRFIVEDRSIVNGIDRLYTKALCVRQRRGKNEIKKSGLYSNSKYLKEVEQRILLYKTDIFKLIEDW